MDNGNKKNWEKPVLEVLSINMTFAGKGTKVIDVATTHDFDIYDPS
ncbi:paeninodin family lasso peptide [Metabacillus halosaccharovorans]